MPKKSIRGASRLKRTISRVWFQRFVDANVFREEHVRLNGGECARLYADMNVLLTHRGVLLWRMIDTILDCYIPEHYRKRPLDIMFVGVGNGGHFANLLADAWLKRHVHRLSEGQTATCFARAERDSVTNFLVFGRHQASTMKGKLVIPVDDVLVTGKTLQELMSLIHACGGKFSRAIILLDRSKKGKRRMRVSGKVIAIQALCRHYIPTYPKAKCRDCKKGILPSLETKQGLEAFHLQRD